MFTIGILRDIKKISMKVDAPHFVITRSEILSACRPNLCSHRFSPALSHLFFEQSHFIVQSRSCRRQTRFHNPISLQNFFDYLDSFGNTVAASENRSILFAEKPNSFLYLFISSVASLEYLSSIIKGNKWRRVASIHRSAFFFQQSLKTINVWFLF